MLNEIKVALRGLLKSPGFSAIAIVTLALAIGANSACSSLDQRVARSAIALSAPDQIVLIWEQFRGPRSGTDSVSPPEYVD